MTTLSHGASRRGKWTPEYRAWASAKSRCYNPKYRWFFRYGGRGITMCDRWSNSFENFFLDMGKRPHGRSLDRINNDGNYEPSNCRWATWRQQRMNSTLPNPVPKKKLNPEQVKEIKRLLDTNESQSSIAQRFGVTQANISAIKMKLTWREI